MKPSKIDIAQEERATVKFWKQVLNVRNDPAALRKLGIASQKRADQVLGLMNNGMWASSVKRWLIEQAMEQAEEREGQK